MAEEVGRAGLEPATLKRHLKRDKINVIYLKEFLPRIFANSPEKVIFRLDATDVTQYKVSVLYYTEVKEGE